MAKKIKERVSYLYAENPDGTLIETEVIEVQTTAGSWVEASSTATNVGPKDLYESDMEEDKAQLEGLRDAQTATLNAQITVIDDKLKEIRKL